MLVTETLSARLLCYGDVLRRTSLLAMVWRRFVTVFMHASFFGALDGPALWFLQAIPSALCVSGTCASTFHKRISTS